MMKRSGSVVGKIDGNIDFPSNKSMYMQETPVEYIYNLYEPVNKLKNILFPIRVQQSYMHTKPKLHFKII